MLMSHTESVIASFSGCTGGDVIMLGTQIAHTSYTSTFIIFIQTFAFCLSTQLRDQEMPNIYESTLSFRTYNCFSYWNVFVWNLILHLRVGVGNKLHIETS